MRKSLLFCAVAALTGYAHSEPGKTQIMYFNAPLEIKLSKEFRERRMPWPVMRVGVADSGKHRFGFIRIKVREGAGHSEVAREIVDCAAMAFRLVPGLVQVDIDATLHDDTSRTKAAPLFAVSISGDTWKKHRADSLPEAWLVNQGALTLSPKLKPDRDPIQVTSDTFWDFYHDAYTRIPITRAKPDGKTRKNGSAAGKNKSGQPELPAQPP